VNGSYCDGRHGCITCGDEGIPMRVLEVADGAAVCADDDGERHEVAVDLVEDVEQGSRLLVHAGVAIGRL
jgi:hydrogenase assembly chaperone HypC/HupF